MTTHLEALDLWQPTEEDYAVHPLPENPKVAQLKNHKERKTRKAKAKACLFFSVSKIIFTRIMNLNSAMDIWNYLKSEYQGSEQTKGMKALNLAREFEMQSMKEAETIKSYAGKLLSIANKVHLLGKDFSDETIVQKILVTVLEKYESKISSLEELKELSNITLGELVNALQAQEQRRMMRHEEVVQGAFHIKAQNSKGGKDKKNNIWKNKKPKSSNKQQNDTFPPCPHCKKTNHSKKIHQRRQRGQWSNKKLSNSLLQHVLLQTTFPVITEKTPFEGWFGYKPDFLNLKIYGCLCFSFIPQLKRDKLDKKAELGVFIAYNNTSKAYRIFQSSIPSGAIVEGEIVAGCINCLVAEARWAKSLSNHGAWAAALLSKKSCALTISYSFWPSEAMREEIKMIEKNDTWELADRPQHKQPIGVKWVYRTKLNTDGSINKYKARLVVKGYAQVFGVDFLETVALVTRLDTIRMLLALTAQKDGKFTI
uniref:Uncharacterized protein n=1 Tax=Cajanus cajan TaxID=3821 RepID=A0A151T9I7_CAJCA|nr:hypothetical protein KK1_018288 [Cajanus cajan]